MDKFLEGCFFLRLNQEEIENINIDKLYQTFREELIPILLKLVQKITEEETLPIHSMKLHTYPDTKTKDTTKKESNKPLSLINIDVKILNKILAN